MEHPLFFLCPSCFSESSITRSRCPVCHTRVQIEGNVVRYDSQEMPSTDYYDLLLDKVAVSQNPAAVTPDMDKVGLGSPLRASRKAILRQGTADFHFRGYHDLFQRLIEKPREIAEGYLILYDSHVDFRTGSERLRWAASQFNCVTTNGHYFEFKIKGAPFYQIHFLHESPLKYEIIFRKWLDRYYQKSGGNSIIEYQPRLIFEPPLNSSDLGSFLGAEDSACDAHSAEAGDKTNMNRHGEEYLIERIALNLTQLTVRALFSIWLKVRIISRENWNVVREGFTIINHQSALDPFIVGAFLDRKIAFLTKSTSFGPGLVRFLLRWLMGVPTTRYQTDPTVIYSMRSLLRHRIRVGIFPEGERTWGGRLHPFKLSVVKLLMSSRQTITPIILKNVFHFLPRWRKLPRRTQIQIVVGAPFCLIPEIYSVDEQREFLEEYFGRELRELKI